jgi:hypothetical protein
MQHTPAHWTQWRVSGAVLRHALDGQGLPEDDGRLLDNAREAAPLAHVEQVARRVIVLQRGDQVLRQQHARQRL